MDIKEEGKRGEMSAASFLAGKGYKIVDRNVRIGHLETDIVAKNDRNIVFAEVKTRRQYPHTTSKYGRPALAVNYTKQQKLIEGAELYLKKNRKDLGELMPRIDIIEVYLSPDVPEYKVLKIIHMENAVGR